MHDDSGIFRRRAPAAIFPFGVTGLLSAEVVIVVDHRDSGDEEWVIARSASLVAPGLATLRVSGLKEELRFRHSGGAEVRALPPTWLQD